MAYDQRETISVEVECAKCHDKIDVDIEVGVSVETPSVSLEVIKVN